MRIPVPLNVARWLVVLAGAACASHRSAPAATNVREGVYVAGFEANTFRECAGTLQWTVEFAPGAEPGSWPDGSHGGYNGTYYFVRWQADLIPPPRVPLGQLPAAPLRARVHSIISVRALRRGECGEQF